MVAWINLSRSNNNYRLVAREELVGFKTVDEALQALAGGVDCQITGYVPKWWCNFTGWLRFVAEPGEEFLTVCRQDPRGPDAPPALRRMAACLGRRPVTGELPNRMPAGWFDWEAATALPFDSLDMNEEGFVALVRTLTVLEAVATL